MPAGNSAPTPQFVAAPCSAHHHLPAHGRRGVSSVAGRGRGVASAALSRRASSRSAGLTNFMSNAKILLLDLGLNERLCAGLRAILEPSFELLSEGVAADAPSPPADELSARVASLRPDVIFVLLSEEMLRRSGEVLRPLAPLIARTPCIVAVEKGGPDETFELLRSGAADFITAPLKEVEVLPRVWRLLEQTRRAEVLPRGLKQRLGLQNIIGQSPAFLAEIGKVPLVARCDACVLISGETGTGKEVYARAVHYLSPREHKPFIPVNCGAIPLELIENELFGHERGAFTGASAAQPGLLREAEGGTLFLDEIDCLPLLAQIKLLRLIQEKEYRPLGSPKTVHADVRVIGASNVDFEQAVTAGGERAERHHPPHRHMPLPPPPRARAAYIPPPPPPLFQKYTHRTITAGPR